MDKIGKNKTFVSMFVIFCLIFGGLLPLSVMGAGDLPFYDIEQDSLGNYHMAFIDDSPGNYEIYYTNDIGGSFPQDWNPPTRITYTADESILLDLGIYLPTDTMFIIWDEGHDAINSSYPNSTGPTYYTISSDYGTSWLAPNRSYENIMLKYDEFDPLVEVPDLPTFPFDWAHPYAYYIVQFKTPTIKDWKDGIEAAGGVFCGYIPKHAFIVWMTPPMKDIVEQLPYIRWIGHYHPMYKIMPALLNNVGIIELNVMVIEETGGQANIDEVILEIQALGGIITYNGYDDFIIRTQIDASRIYDIALIPEVEWIDEWGPPVEFMNHVRVITGADTLHNGIPQFRGAGVTGEVKDNGVDQTHPDLAFFAIDGPVVDGDHGTFTFGTVFSTGLNNGNAMGMMPQGQGVFCDWGVGRRASINNLVTNWGGVFQSNSWGVWDAFNPMDGQYNAWSQTNDQAVFDFDVTMLYAAGNSNQGVQPSSITRDAAAKNIITVGGVNHFDNEVDNDDRWIIGPDVGWGPGVGTTPSQGPAADGRVKPDLCGPFDNGWVTDSVDFDGEDGYNFQGNEPWWPFRPIVPPEPTGNYYDRGSGTSFATPVTAGSAGLVYEMYRADHFGNNPGGGDPQPSTVKAMLIANARQIDVGNPGVLNAAQGDGRMQQGWGFVDVESVYDVGSDHYIINEEIPRQGIVVPFVNYDSHYIDVQSDQELKITLAWTDPAAAPASNPALINDLNLRAIDPDGVAYWGNRGLDTNLWSTAGGGSGTQDDLNNVENVFIENPTEGRWEIRVYGHDINQDAWAPTPELDQTYALVVSYKPLKAVQLFQGWNLISLPLEQEDPYIHNVLSSIDPYYDIVQYYDASDAADPWKDWKRGKGGDLQELHHYMGIYVYIVGISEITLWVKGDKFEENYGAQGYVPVQLHDDAGLWNMVGYPSNRVGISRDAALNNLEWDVDIQAVFIYDTSLGRERELESWENFEQGRGYWFAMILPLPIPPEWRVEIDP